jgi:hypothetical protein
LRNFGLKHRARRRGCLTGLMSSHRSEVTYRVTCRVIERTSGRPGYDSVETLLDEARAGRLASAPSGSRLSTAWSGEESMIIALYAAAALVMAVGSLYLAWRNRDVRKFLAGAFFVSSGILFYLYLADVSVPLLGTGFVETPRISGGRSIVHFILFLLCFYFGFVRKPKA